MTENIQELSLNNDLSADSAKPVDESVPAPGEPPQPQERLTLCGVPVDADKAADPERIEKITAGRRKIPLSLLCRPGGTDMATAAGQDIYIAVVCFDHATVGEERGIKVSDYIFSGSTEITVVFADCSDISGMTFESLKGSCLLIMNPQVMTQNVVRVPSLRLCLKLGTLSGVAMCETENCTKPILPDRDGPWCYRHSAVRAGSRLSIGGGAIDTDLPLELIKKKEKRPSLSTEERAKKVEEQRRQELLAKKRTAVMLANRRATGGTVTGVIGEQFNGSTELMDIGETDAGNQNQDDTKSRLQRFEVLKRKREAIVKHDSILMERQRLVASKKDEEKESIAEAPEPEPVRAERRSMSKQFLDVMKAERGY